MFGVAIGTVTLPLLSQHAAVGNNDAFRSALGKGLRLVFFLTIPAAVGLWMLADPILSVIYEMCGVKLDFPNVCATASRFPAKVHEAVSHVYETYFDEQLLEPDDAVPENENAVDMSGEWSQPAIPAPDNH